MIHACLALCLLGAPSLPQDSQPSIEALTAHVEQLSSEAFGGRALGEPGGQMSVDYMVQALGELGLEPGGPKDAQGQRSFVQMFPMQRYEHAFEPSLVLTKVSGGEDVAVYGKDFNVNVHGLMRGTPKLEIFRFADAGLPISVASPERALLFALGSNFRKRLLTDRGLLEPGTWGLELRAQEMTRGGIALGKPALRYDTKKPSDERFEMVTLLGDFARDLKWLGYSHVQLKADETWKEVQLANVVAVLPGANSALQGESILVQAFYDHQASPPDESGQPERGIPGAGAVASVLELARMLAAGPAPERSVVFLFSAGSAQRAVGVSNYLKRPRFPLAKTAGALSVVRPGVPLESGPGVGLSDYKKTALGAAAAAKGLALVADTPSKATLAQAARLMSKKGLPAQLFGSASTKKASGIQRARFLDADYAQLQLATGVLLGATRLMASSDYALPESKPARRKKAKRRP